MPDRPETPDRLEILPIRGIGEVTPGADLPAVIAGAAAWLRDGDVLVVTSKIVSKAEGRLIDVPPSGPERDAARDEILTAETARPIAHRGDTRIVQTHHGFVMASAGIDASNVERSQLVLLPKDPDASARSLRSGLRERFGLDVGVIVSDTMGRPWRTGLTDVALGSAGVEPIRDHRGQADPYGNEMHLTQMAVLDELSGAAELVKGKFDRVPVAVVRGYPAVTAEDGPGAASLVRAPDHDMFTLGTAEARAAGLSDAAGLADADSFAEHPVDPATMTRALMSIPTRTDVILREAREPSVGHGQVALPEHTAHVIVCEVRDAGDPAQLVALGIQVHRLRCALAAEGLAAIWLPPHGPGRPGDTVRGLLLVGRPRL